MKNLFIAVIAIASFASCKKEKTDLVAPQPTANKNVKKITSTYVADPTETSTYTYDAQGRLTSERTEYTGTLRTSTYDYSTAGKIFVSGTYNGAPNATHECTLNAQGLVVNDIIKSASGTVFYTYVYTYTADGQMTRAAWTTPAGITDHFEYTIENGVVVESKLYRNGTLSNTTRFTYDLTKLNRGNFAFGGSWTGPSFGKPAKNLISNATVTEANGTISWNDNYTYQLDAEGYVVKMNTSNTVTNFSYDSVYEY